MNANARWQAERGRWDTEAQQRRHFETTKPRGRAVDVDFSRVSMFARDQRPADTGGKDEPMFGGLFGDLIGGSQGGVNVLKIALFAGQVVEALATADADGDGKLEPDEIVEAAAKLVGHAARAFPQLAHIAGDPEKLRRAAELQAEFIRLVTA